MCEMFDTYFVQNPEVGSNYIENKIERDIDPNSQFRIKNVTSPVDTEKTVQKGLKRKLTVGVSILVKKETLHMVTLLIEFYIGFFLLKRIV